MRTHGSQPFLQHRRNTSSASRGTRKTLDGRTGMHKANAMEERLRMHAAQHKRKHKLLCSASSSSSCSSTTCMLGILTPTDIFNVAAHLSVNYKSVDQANYHGSEYVKIYCKHKYEGQTRKSLRLCVHKALKRAESAERCSQKHVFQRLEPVLTVHIKAQNTVDSLCETVRTEKLPRLQLQVCVRSRLG
jgi:hypothetical protein